MKTVRVNNGIIVEVLTTHSGFSLSQCYHPDILAQTIEVADDVQVGDPVPVPVIEAVVVEETLVETPTETPSEGA